ncbi:hypothetical protein AVEN_222992-1 [Araneus ventricosus]|uniref:Uncharacterized protein n=1 Tax=Araneus ventricosus TaxID=182803 RepID=A0A4Y2UA87_ARAVE|nr:hypothetical protein AVEN_222992-1 [Araneus ventricosus]
MFLKKKQQKDSHKRRKITVEMKLKIIEKRERGVSLADLARHTIDLHRRFSLSSGQGHDCGAICFKSSEKNVYAVFSTVLKGCFSCG